MLDSKLENALNQHVNQELWSAYLYLSMSYDMDHKGFGGIASWFALQAKEEFTHATLFITFIGKRSGKVRLLPVGQVKQEWNTPKDAFEDTLRHEKVVTQKINQLMDLAVELRDYATQNMLKWFVDEQVEEEDTVIKILEKFKRVENSPSGLFELDKELGAR